MRAELSVVGGGPARVPAVVVAGELGAAADLVAATSRAGCGDAGHGQGGPDLVSGLLVGGGVDQLARSLADADLFAHHHAEGLADGAWHAGYGGGFYISPLTRDYLFTILFESSAEEKLLFRFGIGFLLDR